MKPRIFKSAIACLTLAFTALTLLVNQATAVTYTWDGSTSGFWGINTNWVGDALPVSANTSDMIISGTTNVGAMYSGGTVNLSYTVKSLTFDASNDADTRFIMVQNANPNNGPRNLTFSSNSGNATLTVESGSTGNKLIDRTTGGTGGAATIILTSSLDVIHNGDGTLTLGNSVNASVTGAGGINKSGNGTLVLAGANNYSGATNISAGTLQLNGSTFVNSTVGIGTAGTLSGSGTVNGNATLTGNGIINKASGTLAGTLGVTGGNWNGAGAVTGLVTSSSGVFNIGNGANLTANGGLDVTGGTIAAGDAASTISGSLNYTSSSNSTFAGVIAGIDKTLTVNNATAKLILTGTNTYTGATNVTLGSLVINGAVGSSSIVVAGSLGGSGVMANATLSGSGSINPGNSPGILTASATDPTGGLDYNFEFTSATAPTWSNATASVNDVLRLTSATPFTAALTSANIVSIYLNAGSLSAGNVFTGGFYTDNTADFLGNINLASFAYYLANASGSVSYNGVNYDLYSGPLSINLSTVQVGSADFTGGTITNGYSTQFTVIPEPNFAALIGGFGVLLILRRRR
jgi:autotransporter-associated beta strand protein